jgi:hypothetical protein
MSFMALQSTTWRWCSLSTVRELVAMEWIDFRQRRKIRNPAAAVENAKTAKETHCGLSGLP